MKQPFVVSVVNILGSPGTRMEVDRTGHLEGLFVTGSKVPSDGTVTAQGFVEAIEGPRMVFTGTVKAPWEGECRRCVTVAKGVIEQKVREIFEREPVEGETYPFRGDVVDLEPLIRETVVLELPEAPLCKDDCAGLCVECGANHNEKSCDCDTTIVDPRWAALDTLKDATPNS